LVFCCCFTRGVRVFSRFVIRGFQLSRGATLCLVPSTRAGWFFTSAFCSSLMVIKAFPMSSKFCRTSCFSFSVPCLCPAVCLANLLAISNLFIIQCFDDVCPFIPVAQCLSFCLEVLHKIGDPGYPSGTGLVKEYLNTGLFQMHDKC